MAIIEYEAEFCSEAPFLGSYWTYDREKEKYVQRRYEGRLQVKPDKMFAKVNTPAGIPVLWYHNLGEWDGCAVGRVKTMKFDGTKLNGTLAIDEDDLLKYIPGGTKTLDARINAGLSVGLSFLDIPAVKWDMKDGTYEKPDRMTYGRVEIKEVSLTPMPRIYTAGLLSAGQGGQEDMNDGRQQDD